MDLVSQAEEMLRKVGTVLAGYASDENAATHFVLLRPRIGEFLCQGIADYLSDALSIKFCRPRVVGEFYNEAFVLCLEVSFELETHRAGAVECACGLVNNVAVTQDPCEVKMAFVAINGD
ncbi:MAG TPA: hypothetical protein VGC99_27850, partial [Candidatus Tectomicrobia bacterium]